LHTPARQFELPKERPANPVPEARRATIEAARQVWIRKLIELSRRNSLLYYRPLKTGTLEFSSAPTLKIKIAIIRASHKEPFGGCGDGKYGNPHQSSVQRGQRRFHSCARGKHRRGSWERRGTSR